MASSKNSGSFEALPADLIQRIAASIPCSSDAEARRWDVHQPDCVVLGMSLFVQ